MRPSFVVSFPSVTLTIAEVWPDGDAPENPTAQDVVDAMVKSGSASQVVDEWNLLTAIEVYGYRDGSRAAVGA